jgi:hypothetical protein
MSLESEQNILLPPSPPNREEEYKNNIPIRIRGLPQDIIPGKFSYIESENNRHMLSSAYEAINCLELWDFIKENPGCNGFMFTPNKNISKIYDKIEKLGYMGHSGFSFGYTMRQMQAIANEGEEKFRLEYIKK